MMTSTKLALRTFSIYSTKKKLLHRDVVVLLHHRSEEVLMSQQTVTSSTMTSLTSTTCNDMPFAKIESNFENKSRPHVILRLHHHI